MDPDVIARVAERKIQEAIDEGKLDNLPGKGKPIVFDDDPMTPPHLRLANRILRNANVLPEWMQVQKDLQAERQEIGQVRARMRREYAKRRVEAEASSAPRIAQQIANWHAQMRADYLRRLKSVNTGILKLNLMAPSTVQPGIPFKIEAEMAAFDTEFPPLVGVSPSIESSPSESRLRGIAQERYARGGGSVLVSENASPQRAPLRKTGTDLEDIRRRNAPTDEA